MKFSDVQKGDRAERKALLPGVLTRSGQPVPLLLRPLNDEEDIGVLAAAGAFARAQGAEARNGDPLYDRTVMVKTILLGCLDIDSPVDDRQPFFASDTEISKALDRDAIAMLYELHETFQDEVSPLARKLSPEALYAKVLEVAASDTPDPFVELAPSTRWSSFRTLALLVIGLPDHRSLFGLPSLGPSQKPSPEPSAT